MQTEIQIKPVVVTVGDELILGEHLNDNQTWLFKLFREHHFPVRIGIILPDDVAVIASWIEQLLSQNFYPIFVSGGIGGTHDDCTREGIANGIGVPLTKHKECFYHLDKRYGDNFNSQRQRMAWLPEGCKLIDNPFGAPGFYLNGVFAFPGFPKMLYAMAPPILDELFAEYENQEWLNEEASLPVSEGDVAIDVEAFSKKWTEARLGIYAHSEMTKRMITLRLRYPSAFPEIKDDFQQFVNQLKVKFE